MENRSFYNEILTEHNIRPEFKHDLPDANIVLEGVNPNCGDDIWLKLKVKNGIIEDGAFVGDGCAISQASADIMLGMIVGTAVCYAFGTAWFCISASYTVGAALTVCVIPFIPADLIKMVIAMLLGPEIKKRIR